MMRFFSSSDSTASLTTSIPTKRTEKVSLCNTGGDRILNMNPKERRGDMNNACQWSGVQMIPGRLLC